MPNHTETQSSVEFRQVAEYLGIPHDQPVGVGSRVAQFVLNRGFNGKSQDGAPDAVNLNRLLLESSERISLFWEDDREWLRNAVSRKRYKIPEMLSVISVVIRKHIHRPEVLESWIHNPSNTRQERMMFALAVAEACREFPNLQHSRDRILDALPVWLFHILFDTSQGCEVDRVLAGMVLRIGGQSRFFNSKMEQWTIRLLASGAGRRGEADYPQKLEAGVRRTREAWNAAGHNFDAELQIVATSIRRHIKSIERLTGRANDEKDLGVESLPEISKQLLRQLQSQHRSSIEAVVGSCDGLRMIA